LLDPPELLSCGRSPIAQVDGVGAFVVGVRMIDAPFVRRAEAATRDQISLRFSR
jgi:hypothetical protein